MINRQVLGYSVFRFYMIWMNVANTTKNRPKMNMQWRYNGIYIYSQHYDCGFAASLARRAISTLAIIMTANTWEDLGFSRQTWTSSTNIIS